MAQAAQDAFPGVDDLLVPSDDLDLQQLLLGTLTGNEQASAASMRLPETFAAPLFLGARVLLLRVATLQPLGLVRAVQVPAAPVQRPALPGARSGGGSTGGLNTAPGGEAGSLGQAGMEQDGGVFGDGVLDKLFAEEGLPARQDAPPAVRTCGCCGAALHVAGQKRLRTRTGFTRVPAALYRGRRPTGRSRAPASAHWRQPPGGRRRRRPGAAPPTLRALSSQSRTATRATRSWSDG